MFKSLSRIFSRKPKRGPQLEIVNGTLQVTRSADPGATDPGTLIITKNYAVIFEDRSGKFTRSEFGPATVSILPDEIPAKIMLTRPRFKRLSVAHVMTVEGVMIDLIEFGILYQLETDPHLSKTPNIQYPVSQETLLKVAYGVALWEDDKRSLIDDWETAVQETAVHFIRAEFEKTRLDALFNSKTEGGPVHELSERARRRLETYVSNWGVTVTALQINYIALPKHLRERIEQKWLAERLAEIKEAEGRAEAKKITEIERAKGEAWLNMAEEMKDKFSENTPSHVLATRYIQILQYFDSLIRMADSPSTKIVTPYPTEITEMLKSVLEKPELAKPSQAEAQASGATNGREDGKDDRTDEEKAA